MLDLAPLPVVDVHCHPFANKGRMSPEQFTNTVSFGGGSAEYMAAGGMAVDKQLLDELQRNKREVLYFRYMVQLLARFFDCPPDLEQIMAARNEAIGRDYTGYIRRLFHDCGLTTLVVDFGYPQPPIEASRFMEDMPAEVVPIYRIEPLIVELLDSGCAWEEFRRRFDEGVAGALEHAGYRGVKSIIAYRTGLDVSPLSRTPDQGLQALDALRRGTGGQAMKKLRDHLLCRALELCMEYNVPMQIHTGIGDFEVNLVMCRPALLMDLLRFPAFRACRVLLVHTGYPYHAEAGYMANVLPRVYCDVSEGIPFAGNAARRIFAEVLEMAPLSKVVYGSDGYGSAEINYVGAKLGKQALALALQELSEAGMLPSDEAKQAAGMILSDNARQLYQLDE
jgi:predicted TIM-barrel fold metal-dependent hydrolase